MNYYVAKGFEEAEVGIAPMRTHSVSRFLHAQRKQNAMGDTLNKVAMQVTGTMYELWDKA